MEKRLLDCSPREMLSLTPSELKAAIRMSEGRVISACARSRSTNYFQYVSNAEVVGKFGADIVIIDVYNPKNPIFSGLPSKNPRDDEPFRGIQVQIGKGWTVREVRNLVGRPLGVTMFIAPPSYGSHNVDTGFSDKGGNNFNTWDEFDLAIEQGFDFIYLGGWSEPDQLVATAKEAICRAKGRVVIWAGVAHGPGLIYAKESPYNLRELMTINYAKALADVGVDIVDIPAAGSLCGYTMDYVGKLIDSIHMGGAIVNVGIHNSQEGADVETIRRIAIDNKIIGADMQMLGDAGVNENIGLPETLESLCIAVKGKHHTYRRMAESILR